MRAQLSLMFALLAAVLATTSCYDDTHLVDVWESLRQLPKEEYAEFLRLHIGATTKNALDNKIIEAIKKLLQSPAFNPLVIPELNIGLDHSIASLNCSLDTITASGLSGLAIDNLHVSILLLKVDFTTTLPSIEVNGNYSVDGDVHGLMPIFGSGPFEVSATGIKVGGAAKIGLQNGSVYIKNLALALELGAFHVNIQHLLNDDDTSEIINNMINDMGMNLFEQNKEMIQEMIASEAITRINSLIKGLSIQDIIDIITGGKSLLTETVSHVLT